MASTIAQQIIDDYEDMCTDVECFSDANDWFFDVIDECHVGHVRDGNSEYYSFKDGSELFIEGRGVL